MHKVTTDFVHGKEKADGVGDVFVLTNNYSVDNLWMIISADGSYSLVGLGKGESWTDDYHSSIDAVFGGERHKFEKLPDHSKITLFIGEG